MLTKMPKWSELSGFQKFMALFSGGLAIVATITVFLWGRI